MALVEEDLPGVRKGSWNRVFSQACSLVDRGCIKTNASFPAVKKDFQVREDSIIAQQLQERECEIEYSNIIHRHFN